LGFNLAGASAFLWVRIWAWRTVSCVAVPIGLLALIASAITPAYVVLLALTAISGAAFGAMFSIAGVALGDTYRPTRWYGVKTAIESLVGAALMIILTSSLSPWSGFGETVGGMVVLVVLLSPMLFFLPAQRQTAPPGKTATKDNVSAPGGQRRVLCALGVVLVFFAGNSGIWAFSERLGATSGFDPASIGALLSLTLVCGVCGSLAVAAWGARVNTFLGVACACGAVVFALVILGLHLGFSGYAVGLCLYMVGWSAGVPLAFAEVARLDPDGRYTALATPALGLGSMAGPAIVGVLFGEGHHTGPVIVFGVCCMVSTCVLAAAASPKDLAALLRGRAGSKAA
jgi:predicted MFS family arabinose efflux permease